MIMPAPLDVCRILIYNNLEDTGVSQDKIRKLIILMKTPAYKVIHDSIIEKITSRSLRPGDRIPSEKELALQFNVSRITSKRALDILAQDGVIQRVQGKGSFVQTVDFRFPESPAKAGILAKQNQKKLLGLIVPDVSDSFGLDLIVGFEGACSANHVNFLFKRSYGSPESENAAIQMMLEAGVDGIGIMPLYGEFYNPAILQLILDGFPIVIIDRHYPGIHACFAGTDNIKSAQTAVHYLLQNGHRSISFLSPPVQMNSALMERMQGMAAAYTEMGLQPDRSLWFDQINSTLPRKNKPDIIDANVHMLIQHFKEHPQITAIFASEHDVALIARKALLAMKLRVPDDVSILCFDLPSSLDNDYEFTHIKQNEVAIAEYAVNKLCNFQASNAHSFFMVEGKLKVGRSTRSLL